MTTFATVLQTIITHYRLRIVDLAPYTGITASYISNLKRGDATARPSRR